MEIKMNGVFLVSFWRIKIREVCIMSQMLFKRMVQCDVICRKEDNR